MPTHEEYLNGSRIRLEEMALQYARMKTFGTTMQDERTIHISQTDRKDYEDLYCRYLCNAAVDLLREMTMAPLPPVKKPEAK